MKNALILCVIAAVLSISTKSFGESEGLDASLSGGYMASFLSEEASSSYTAELDVDGPLVVGEYDGLRIRSRLDLGLLPGEGDIQNPDTYNSVEFSSKVSVAIGKSYNRKMDQRIWTSLYIEGGFAALRKKSENPTRKESPVWMGGGILFEEREKRAFLSIGLYADQRLDGLYQPTIGVSGGIELPLSSVLQTDKVKVKLVGDAILGLNDYTGRGAGRQVRVGVMLGI